MATDYAGFRDRTETEGETPYEELASALVHLVGAVLAAAALALLLVLAAATESVVAIAACAVYGAAVFLTLLFSALCHGLWHAPAKAVFETLDHCSIFAMIAGTYTPLTVLTLPQPQGADMLAMIWASALVGIALRLWIGRLHWTLILVFLAMGWLGVVWGGGALFRGLGDAGAGLLVAGGLAYTVGLGFFLWRSLPFNHAVWHLLVIVGAACHFAMVALYALPHAG